MINRGPQFHLRHGFAASHGRGRPGRAGRDPIPSNLARPVQVKAERLRTRLRAGGLNMLASQSQIVPVLVGDNEAVITLACALRERDLIVAAVRPPSVAPGTAAVCDSPSASLIRTPIWTWPRTRSSI